MDIKESKAGFVALATKRYKRKGAKNTRHHFGKCAFCGAKIRIMMLHYKKYHPEFVDQLNKSIKSGHIHMIEGMRVMKTSLL